IEKSSGIRVGSDVLADATSAHLLDSFSQRIGSSDGVGLDAKNAVSELGVSDDGRVPLLLHAVAGAEEREDLRVIRLLGMRPVDRCHSRQELALQGRIENPSVLRQQ